MGVTVLLDTHVLLWSLVDDAKLSPEARAIIKAPETVLLVSSASGWEIATKHRLGKLPEAAEVVNYLPRHLRRLRAEVLPISLEHALLAGGLPGPHRDPFDRMIIAQGQAEGVPVVTADPVFKNYGVQVIW